MAKTLMAAAIIAIGLAAMGYFVGGRYTIIPTTSNAVTRLDRFTGEVAMCVPGASEGSACGFIFLAPVPAQ